MKALKNIAAATLILMACTNVTNAQTAIPASYQVTSNDDFDVKYLGSDDNYLVFEVNAPAGDNNVLQVADRNEGELYTTSVTKSLKGKIIKIEKIGDQQLDFKLQIGKKTYQKSFTANTKQVEKTTVAEKDITKL